MATTSENIFYELPQALVEEMLQRCSGVSSKLSASFNTIKNSKETIRKTLIENILLHRDAEITALPFNPTTCGVDGSYALDRLLSTDIAAVAALAVEGLTPPTEKRHWPYPRHISEIMPIPHNEATPSILRALMMCFELRLTAEAPHDVVMIDGSFTSPMIALNQALGLLNEAPKELGCILEENAKEAANSIKVVLESNRSDKIYVALPKYTEKKDLSSTILNLEGYEDRGLLSFVLEAGEYVGPLEKGATSEPWNIQKIEGHSGFVKTYIEKIRDLRVIYYRPFTHMPVLRLEVPGPVTRNTQRLSILFEAIKIQCGAASIFEPYPLYLADRMVKHLSSILPALRRTTTQQIAESWGDDLGAAFLAMHGYRTESG
jgi:hypothetical protein